jgi:hypothetical protein
MIVNICMSQQKTRRQEFSEEIDRALGTASPYKHVDKNLHQVYCVGLLKELLLYSGIDMMEVRRHIRSLGDPTRPKSGR